MALFPIQYWIDFFTSTEYLGKSFQTQVKGTSIDREVIHKHLHDALNEVRKYSNRTSLEGDGGMP